MATGPDAAFDELYGRQPTDAERLRLMKVKNALKLPDDDGIWALFIALGHFETLYEDMPRRIEETTNKLCQSISTTAEKATIARLAEHIAQRVDEISGRVALQRLIYAAVVALAIFAAGIGAVYYFAQRSFDHELMLARAEYHKHLVAEVRKRMDQNERLLLSIRAAMRVSELKELTDDQIKAVSYAMGNVSNTIWAKEHEDIISILRRPENSFDENQANLRLINWLFSGEGRKAKAFFDENSASGGLHGFNQCNGNNSARAGISNNKPTCSMTYWSNLPLR